MTHYMATPGKNFTEDMQTVGAGITLVAIVQVPGFKLLNFGNPLPSTPKTAPRFYTEVMPVILIPMKGCSLTELLQGADARSMCCQLYDRLIRSQADHCCPCAGGHIHGKSVEQGP